MSPKGYLKNPWKNAVGGRHAGGNAPRALWSAAACCRFSPASLLAPYRSKSRAAVRGQQAGPAERQKAAASCRTPELALPSTRWACLALCGLFLFGCRLDMHVQPKYKPLDPSNFFGDGRSERPEVPGVVAHGHLRTDELLYTGKLNGEPADAFPFPITRKVLERGRERYNIYCSPCHDYTGSGRGLVVQRGFPPPPSYHLERLLKAPAGHFFEVISNGYRAMYSYASRVAPEDRWAIVAYIRALQLSQHATLEDVPPQEREHLVGAHGHAPLLTEQPK